VTPVAKPSRLTDAQDSGYLLKRSMNIMRTLGMAFVAAVFAMPAGAADTATEIKPPSMQRLKEISPSELKIAPTTPDASPSTRTESARPPANPALAETRTPEEAAQARAADPKDPSAGAINIKVPITGAKP
jgi:hypothetical protein